MSENRCERCKRKLSDPTAQYGWRCAEILGVDQGDLAFISGLLDIQGNYNDLVKTRADSMHLNMQVSDTQPPMKAHPSMYDYDPWLLEDLTADLYGKSVENWDFDSIQSDVDLIARLLFHEDATEKGQFAIAWTIKNNMDMGYDLRTIITKWYANPEWMKEHLDLFFQTDEWLKNHDTWGSFHQSYEGRPTRDSWISAIAIAQALVDGRLGKNPFAGIAPDDTKVVQYLGLYGGKNLDTNPDFYRIGNSYFYKYGVKSGN